MEFNSIYVKESKLSDENKFILDFAANEEEVKRVVFKPSHDHYITTLDANIVFEEDKEALNANLKASDQWDDILKLSKLSNELAKKGAAYQNDIDSVLFKTNEPGLASQTEKLSVILTDELIDAMSFKYRYYDVEEYRFKEGKIYDPYKHFRDLGISFKVTANNYDKIYKAKLSFKNNKILQSLTFDRKLFNFDAFYLAQNQFFVTLSIVGQPSRKFVGSYGFYHKAINYYYQGLGINVPSANQAITNYYQRRYPAKHKFVICASNEFNSLSATEKSTIRFIVGRTTTLRPGTVYVAKRNIRGPIADSILKDALYIQTIKLSQKRIDQIKRDQFPDFPLTELEEYQINLDDTNISLAEKIRRTKDPRYWKRANWGNSNLHYYPFYNWPENNYFYVEAEHNKYSVLFNTPDKTILNGDAVKLINKAEHTAIKDVLSKNVKEIKELIDKIGKGSQFDISFVRRNFFIYDDSNFINNTLITEINKKIQVYGQVVVDTTALNTRNNIIKPTEPLKFASNKLAYKDKIVLQIEDIREKKKIKTYDHKIKNITIVSVHVNRNILKEKMFDVVDTVSIIGLESFDNYTRLNPISITVSNNDLIGYLTQSKKYKYRLIPRGLLFGSNIVNDTQVIHVTCDGLSDAKLSILNGKVYKTLGQINLSQIVSWENLKKKDSWVYAQFHNSSNVEFGIKHFAYPFETAVLTDILNFDVLLLDDNNKPIEFRESDKKKVPSFSFDIQIIR